MEVALVLRTESGLVSPRAGREARSGIGGGFGSNTGPFPAKWTEATELRRDRGVWVDWRMADAAGWARIAERGTGGGASGGG